MQLLIYRHNATDFDRGDIVEVRASGAPIDAPQSFAVVEIPEPMSALRQYGNRRWQTDIQHEIVNDNAAQDAYRIKLQSASARGIAGAVNRAVVEMFINNWGGQVFSDAPNEVVFDISIYNAIVSRNFWERDVSQIQFSELSYTQSGGIHRIQADYSALPINPTAVETMAEQQGATIISHANKILVFESTRAVVRDKFLADVKARGTKRVKPFRYKLSEAIVAAAETAGVLQTTLANVQANIIDKVTE